MVELAPFIIVFALSFSIALMVAPLAQWLGTRYGIIAVAGGRRLNEGDKRGVSKLGGLCLFLGFTITVLIAQLLPVPRLDPYEIIRLAGLLMGGVFIFAVGILDDVLNLRSFPQFIAQFIAAGIAISFQIFIEYINNPFTGQQSDPWPFIFTAAVSFFWLVGMMNTVNWLDGADGLAGGVAFIAGATLFINSAFVLSPPQTSVSLLMLALMGSSLGFLLFNFYPARIFMGGGAVYLGYLLGTLSIIGGAKMATILLVMGLPLLDVGWQILNRLRQGRSPFDGDRGHIHFRLLDLGFSQRQIVIGYYVFCALFGGINLVVESQMFKFLAMGVMFALAVVGFAFVARSGQAGSSKSS